MDLYYGSGIDDSLVPRDQDLLFSAHEAFNPHEMFFIMKNTNPTEVEEFNVNNDESCNNKNELGIEDQSTSSSVCGGFAECDLFPNFQLQDLNFVLEDLPCVENVNKSYFLESNGCLEIEAPPIIVLDPFEPIIRDEGAHEEFSVEEFILQDLQMVIEQFTTKSRISFRDAMYRLASDTKQEHVVQDQKNGSHNMEKEVKPIKHGHAYL